eukprot:1108177-Pelagomonas_calceolata.AAC.1
MPSHPVLPCLDTPSSCSSSTVSQPPTPSTGEFVSLKACGLRWPSDDSPGEGIAGRISKDITDFKKMSLGAGSGAVDVSDACSLFPSLADPKICKSGFPGPGFGTQYLLHSFLTAGHRNGQPVAEVDPE